MTAPITGRAGSGDLVGRVAVFLVAWLVTYDKAVVCGDDIYHFQDRYGSSVFLPNFAPGWIPNRVVDLYGRNLLAHLFDLVFFPLHSLFGADFFYVFKLFNATLFAAFLCVVHWGLLRRCAGGGALLSLFVGGAVLLIMPWTNEVRAVCYELPGFLGFMVLAAFFDLMPGEARAAPPWLLAAGFAAAFSLEGDTAILLGAMAVTWVLAAPWREPGMWRRDVTVFSGLMAVFCLAALMATVAFSQRDGLSESFIPVAEFAAFLFHGGPAPDPNPLFFAAMLLAGLAGLGGIALFRRRFLGLCGEASTFRWAALFGLVGCVTLVVAALISLETNQNFFTFRAYPWGGLLLIPMLFAVPAVAALLEAARQGGFVLQAGRVLVMAVALSRIAVAATSGAAQGYQTSETVLTAYHAVLAGGGPVIDTGLGLEGIEMQQRPLPTPDSTVWFIGAYKSMFWKYYGVVRDVTFR
jgi:hypothetical protein